VVPVVKEVRRLHVEGNPIDDGLFEKVAANLGMSAGTVKNRYYSKYRKQLEASAAAGREGEQLREREGFDALLACCVAEAKHDLADVRAGFVKSGRRRRSFWQS
jgi:hypothetical protein